MNSREIDKALGFEELVNGLRDLKRRKLEAFKMAIERDKSFITNAVSSYSNGVLNKKEGDE